MEKVAAANSWAPQDVAAKNITDGGGGRSIVRGALSPADERKGEAFALGHLAESTP